MVARAVAASILIGLGQFIAGALTFVFGVGLLFSPLMFLAPITLPVTGVTYWAALYLCARLPLELLERLEFPGSRRPPRSVAPIIATRSFLISLFGLAVWFVAFHNRASFAGVVIGSLVIPTVLGLNLYGTLKALVAEPPAEPSPRPAMAPPAAPAAAAPAPAEPAPQPSNERFTRTVDRSAPYLVRLWRGQVSLPVTYWVWTVGASYLLFFFGALLPPLLLLLPPYALFCAIIVWRSANNYQGPTLWRVLARVGVVLLVSCLPSIALILGSDAIVGPIVRFLG